MRDSSKLILTVLLIFSGISTPVRARLGETQADIERRYGSSIDQNKVLPILNDLAKRLGINGSEDLSKVNVCAYRNGNWIVAVVYMGNQSVCEHYFKLDSFDLTEDETSNFLKINSDGKEWTPIDAADGDKNNQKWTLPGPDQKPAAIAFLGGRWITFVNTTLLDFIKQQHANAAGQDANQKTQALKNF